MLRNFDRVLPVILILVVGFTSACDSTPTVDATTEPAVTSSPTNTVPYTLASQIDQFMQEEHPSFSGTILVAQEGDIVINKGYGMANREHDVPNTPQTKYSIGSITKSFTAMAIMILQEQGLLKVDDLICDHLTDCPEAWKPITIHQLLNHTSGIPNYSDLAREGKITAEGCIEYEPEEVMAFFKDFSLDFSPGSEWRYSNSGYYLLGMMIEIISGKDYDSFIQENILQPLGLRESGYNHAHIIVKNRASGYSIGQLEVINAAYVHVSAWHGTGGLYASTGDLYKWDQALYTDQLVSQDTLDAIFTPTAEVADDVEYGYGWFLSQQSGHRVIEHEGWVPGFASHIARYPEDQVTTIILSNLDSIDVVSISEELFILVIEWG